MFSLHFFLFSFFLLSQSNGTPNKIPHKKLCINCKYYIPEQHNYAYDYTVSHLCGLFPKDIQNNDDLITGVPNFEPTEYYSCSLARNFDSMCGKEGKMYKKKYTRRLNVDDSE